MASTFLKDSKVVQNATTKLADAVLAYLDKHPQGLVSLVDRIRGSDGRELLLDTPKVSTTGNVNFRLAD